MTVIDKVEDLQQTPWDACSWRSPWMSSFWLEVFAKAGGPRTRYLLFHRSEQLSQHDATDVIGLSLLQHLPVASMKLGKSLRPQLVGIIFGKEVRQFGQVLFSGPGGHAFAPGVDGTALLVAAQAALGEAQSATWLIKDLIAASDVHPHWHALDVLPELVLTLPQEWQSEQDYLAAMKSKYRRRLHRARRKFDGLTRRRLSASQLRELQDEVHQLYNGLIERAEYVPFVVPRGYFSALAEQAAEQVVVTGYYHQQQLVGFSTLLYEGEQAIAHYAAIAPAYNESHQLYLNLLVDLISASIDAGVTSLNFGRTATTIKTSVGAHPEYLHSLARHDGCIRNQLVGALNARVLGEDDRQAQIQHPFG